MLGGSHSPSVASDLDDIGFEKFQPPDREGRLESSAPDDILHNGGATSNADVGTVLPIPLELLHLKMGKDITTQMTTLKRAGEHANADISSAVLIPPKVPQLKLVEDINLQMATPKPTSAATYANDCTALPIPPKVPSCKLVKDITSQIIALKSSSAASNSDYGTFVTIPVKLVKDITLHTATQKPATTAEKAIQQKKRKANNGIGESPLARLKLNIDDLPLDLSARSSESSTLSCLSRAVLMDYLRSLVKLGLDDETPGTLSTSLGDVPMDNLRSLTKLDLDDETPGTLLTPLENTHFLNQAKLKDNLRALAKNHSLSDVAINDSKEKEHEQ